MFYTITASAVQHSNNNEHPHMFSSTLHCGREMYKALSENAYPRYRRRPSAPTEKAAAENPDNYGQAFQYKDKSGKLIRVDNRQVVPFNAFLSAKYKSHINTEFVAGEGCTKYLCKYVMKGADMAFIEVKGGPDKQQKVDYDEFHQIRLARYITSMEAFLSLNGTKLVRRSHEVDELDVHGPSGHRIAVEFGLKDEEEDLNAVCEAAQAEEDRRARGEERVTQLTAYFAFNRDNAPLGLTYAKCNKKLWYDIAKKQWKPYVRRVVQKFCRLKTVSPNNRELLAIRLLLLVVCDPAGWEALRTHDGIVHGSFIEAAKARGLLSDNDLWMNTIMEAFQTKKSIRQRIRWLAVFFATANLSSPTTILDSILKDADNWLVNTSVAKASADDQKQYVLRAMEWFLLANGITPDSEPREDGSFESACEHIGLPRPLGLVITKETFMKLAFFRDDIVNQNLHDDFLEQGQRVTMQQDYLQKYLAGPKPNAEQEQLIDSVFKGLEDARNVIEGRQAEFDPAVQRLFMVTGEGGAGKTFTYNKIIARAKSVGMHFLAMASTGIAAELLYEGQTVHKRICRMKHVDSSTSPNVDYESNFAHMLRNIHSMLIDEISMQNKDVLEFVDRLLRSVAPDKLKEIPFAGKVSQLTFAFAFLSKQFKVVVIGGDWKQLTPVIPGGTDRHQLEASVKNSSLSVRLRANHRLLPGQHHYRAFLKRVGTGTINDSQGRVKLPSLMVQPSRNELINEIFPADLLTNPTNNWKKLAERAILCPLNRDTLTLNEIIMERLNTAERVYHAVTLPLVDETGENELENVAADADHENLSRMTPPGIPEHTLRVRVGAVMMIIRNISLEEGLCNGTRVQVTELFDNIIRCRILTGTHVGNEHDLHAARFTFGGDPKAPHEGPFKCERIQYPLRPGSVMTINKAQGQTLARVGVLLDSAQCFSHGQLYVALSRVRDANTIRVCTTRSDRRVKNVVMRELLDEEDDVSMDVSLPDDPSDPFPHLPPPDTDPEDNLPGETPDDKSMFKTPTSRTRTISSSASDVLLESSVTKQHLAKITLVKGDITKQKIFMIVNAANNTLTKGGGVDDAIHRACAPEQSKLKALLDVKLASNGGPIADGCVIMTPTFGALANDVQYIAHAIGPRVGGTVTDRQKQTLASCYRNALDLLSDTKMKAGKNEPRSIAFPSIATGAFRFPRKEATQIAISSILNWLAARPQGSPDIDEIRLVAFQEADFKLYKLILEQVKRQLNAPRRSTPRSAHPSQLSSSPAVTPVTGLSNKIGRLLFDRTTHSTSPPATKKRAPQRTTATQNTEDFCEIIDEVAAIPGPSNMRPAQVSSQQSRQVRIQNVIGDGSCFFRAIVNALVGEDSELYAGNLRRHLFMTLGRMVADPNCYPKGFTSREEFMDFAQAFFCGEDVTFDQYIAGRLRPNDWAASADAFLAAILLQQTIVVVVPLYYTHLLPGQERESVEYFDSRYRHRLEIYFPDGQRLMVHQDFPDEQFGNFTATQGPGEQRQVIDPVVIWYNGTNHYQTVVLPSRPPASRFAVEIVRSPQFPPSIHLFGEEVEAMEISAPAVAPTEPIPSTSSGIEEMRSPAVTAPSVDTEEDVFLEESLPHMQACKCCNSAVVSPALAEINDRLRQQFAYYGYLSTPCCGDFHLRCFEKWNQSPSSYALKRLHDYDGVDDNCPNCHRRIVSTLADELATAPAKEERTDSSEHSDEPTEPENQQLTEAVDLALNINEELYTPIKVEYDNTSIAYLAVYNAMIRAKNNCYRNRPTPPPEMLAELRKCAEKEKNLFWDFNASTKRHQFAMEQMLKMKDYLKATAQAKHRQCVKEQLCHSLKEATNNKAPIIREQHCLLIQALEEQLYDIIKQFLLLWHSLQQICPSTATLDSMQDWLQSAEVNGMELARLADSWVEHLALINENIKSCVKKCNKAKMTKSFMSVGQLTDLLQAKLKLVRKRSKKKAVRVERHPLLDHVFEDLRQKHFQLEAAIRKQEEAQKTTDQEQRPRANSIGKKRRNEDKSGTRETNVKRRAKAAQAAEQRMQRPILMTAEQAKALEAERIEAQKRMAADRRVQDRLRQADQFLKQHLDQQKRLKQRNLVWGRHAAYERYINERLEKLKADVNALRKSARESMNFTEIDIFLPTRQAVEAYCADIIRYANHHAELDVQKAIKEHQQILERRQRALDEERQRHLLLSTSRVDDRQWAYREDPLLSAELERIRQQKEQIDVEYAEEQARLRNIRRAEEEARSRARNEMLGLYDSPESEGWSDEDLFYNVRQADRMPIMQEVGVAQMPSEAIRAREVIDRRLNFQEADYVGEMTPADKGDDNRGPVSHPHFTSVNMRILGRKEEGRHQRADSVCLICHLQLLRGQLISVLPCERSVNHTFHTICIRRWLATNRTCPVCRRDVRIRPLMDQTDDHLRAFNEYAEGLTNQPISTQRQDDDFVARAWRHYEQLLRPEHDSNGAVIRQPMRPRLAYRQVMQHINRGNFDRFGGQHHTWDITDPRNDEDVAYQMCQTLLQERAKEDDKNWG
ncbi:hypothetical protein niasHT_036318 [Heterodera trifolii]|uniref:ATP-dependent DNA helicase n=1 Tax=Heterodera trifolii TaxID=157864 RepID=A0ABD2HZ85_9BILA